jgi:kinesin family protein C2/C3
MEGTADSVGINYKAIQELFEIIYMRREETSYTLSLTIIEVYNEQVRNLLDPDQETKLEIRETSTGKVTVQNLEPVPVASYEDVIMAMD